MSALIEFDRYGYPKLIGHRIWIRHFVSYLDAGYDIDRIQKEAYPHLTREEIQAAIDYVRDHREDVDRQQKEYARMVGELIGDFWPEEEDIDEFNATVRKWREEGA